MDVSHPSFLSKFMCCGMACNWLQIQLTRSNPLQSGLLGVIRRHEVACFSLPPFPIHPFPHHAPRRHVGKLHHFWKWVTVITYASSIESFVQLTSAPWVVMSQLMDPLIRYRFSISSDVWKNKTLLVQKSCRLSESRLEGLVALLAQLPPSTLGLFS